MTSWNHHERFQAVINGEQADRPPVSAWGHFVGKEENALDLAESTIAFQKKYEWDFVKINPRATIFGEAWGNESDFNNYIGDVPKIKTHTIHTINDLEKVQKLNLEECALGEQLETTKLVKEGVGNNTPILQTLFTPVSILEYIAGHKTVASSRSAARDTSPIPQMIDTNPELVHQALANITDTLIEYVEKTLKAGADGFFYAVLGLARDGMFTTEEFKEFVTDYDLKIMEATQGCPLLFHTCGPHSNPDRFKDYPVDVLHWADRLDGNPSLPEATKWLGNKVAMGGVFEELFVGNNEKLVEEQAKQSLKNMKDQPFILAPGCGLPPHTNEKSLEILKNAVY